MASLKGAYDGGKSRIGRQINLLARSRLAAARGGAPPCIMVCDLLPGDIARSVKEQIEENARGLRGAADRYLPILKNQDAQNAGR
ncbi:MAG: hypothetical protein ABJ205_13230 [Erythrobacter sp.]|uniref:hypothetical protein n=1 Tax=Erythrobacter sp. TaxID=1042 RepID=UPI0032643B31